MANQCKPSVNHGNLCELCEHMWTYVNHDASFWNWLIIDSYTTHFGILWRPGIHESHVGYYYNRCFRKALNPKLFGVTTAAEVCVPWWKFEAYGELPAFLVQHAASTLQAFVWTRTSSKTSWRSWTMGSYHLYWLKNRLPTWHSGALFGQWS